VTSIRWQLADELSESLEENARSHETNAFEFLQSEQVLIPCETQSAFPSSAASSSLAIQPASRELLE
jgi:hypothetical protein